MPGTIFSRMRRSVLGVFDSKASKVSKTLRSANAAFRVLEQKRGGMGIVYICVPLTPEGEEIEQRRAQAGQVRLALKTFPEEFFFDRRMNEAFRNELFIWTRLRGVPFIVPAFDQAVIDGKPYIVMMAIPPDEEGRVSMADHIVSSPGGLAPKLCLSIALGVAIGMERATEREAGLVHGDIKPSNILLMNKYPMIADFGIARLGEAVGRPGVLGTHEYLAPECWPSKELSPTGFSTASDVYAFGCTLLQALTGTAPFTGEAETLLEAHRSGEPAEKLAAGASRLALMLQELALRCIRKAPDTRPGSFSVIRAEIEDIAQRESPVVLEQLQRFADDEGLQSMMSGESVGAQMNSMLARGDHDGAFSFLNETPVDGFRGADLIAAGSAASLSGDDERALMFFARFEAERETAEPDDVAHCANERGLSLARLRRYEEAITAYTDGLQFASSQRRASLIANRAMSQLELKDTTTAARSLELLLREHPREPEIWGQLALVRIAEAKATEAVDAIQRAIGLDPRNGHYRFILASVQMDLLKNVPAAKASLDIAYQLGATHLDWARRMVICCMLIGETGDAHAILQAAARDLGETEGDAFARSVVEGARSLLDDETSQVIGIAEEEGVTDSSQPSGADSGSGELEYDQDTVADDGGLTPSESIDGALPEQDDDIPLSISINEGGTFLNIKLYMLENTFCYDFYCLTERPGYVDACVSSIRKMDDVRSDSEVMGRAEVRVRNYAFYRCGTCGFPILTNRDPGESLLCRMCDTKGPVAYVEETSLKSLAADVNQALGLDQKESAADGACLMVAFWPTSQDQLAAIKRHMDAAEFRHLKNAPSAQMFMMANARQRGVKTDDKPEVWTKAPTEADRSDRTPESFETVLRAIRRDVGQTTSMSMIAPPNIAPTLTADLSTLEQSLLDSLREDFRESPTDGETARHLVETLVGRQALDEAREVHATIRQASPAADNDPDILVAGAQIAYAEDRLEDADRLFGEALRRAPRDQLARLDHMRVLEEMGDDNRLQAVRAELMAHGDPMTAMMAKLAGGPGANRDSGIGRRREKPMPDIGEEHALALSVFLGSGMSREHEQKFQENLQKAHDILQAYVEDGIEPDVDLLGRTRTALVELKSIIQNRSGGGSVAAGGQDDLEELWRDTIFRVSADLTARHYKSFIETELGELLSTIRLDLKNSE